MCMKNLQADLFMGPVLCHHRLSVLLLCCGTERKKEINPLKIKRPRFELAPRKT